MRSLTAEELLIAAERLRFEPLPRRGAALLALASELDVAGAMALPLGERDGRLLSLRAATFGRELTAVASCPQCSERCEVTLDANVFAGETRGEIEVDGIRARVPNGEDVLAAIGSNDARRMLLARCVLDADVHALSDQTLANIEAELERADPRADLRLALRCPACGAQWENALDITSFFWAEIRTAAARLASEVHVLASAYGWREADILAMTPWRRQLYVELVSA